MNTHRLGSAAIAATLAAMLTSACDEQAPSDPGPAAIGGALNKVTTKPVADVQKVDALPQAAPKAPTLEAKPLAKPGVQAPIGVVKPVELSPGKINGINCGASCGGSCGEPEDLAAKPLGSTATVVEPTPKLSAPTVKTATPAPAPQTGPIVLPPKPE